MHHQISPMRRCFTTQQDLNELGRVWEKGSSALVQRLIFYGTCLNFQKNMVSTFVFLVVWGGGQGGAKNRKPCLFSARLLLNYFMAALLQPEQTWTCNFAEKYESLEHISRELVDVQDWQQFADRFSCISSRETWERWLRSGKAEDAGSIAQTAMATSLAATSADAEKLLADFYRAVVNVGEEQPMVAALVLGGTLSGLRNFNGTTSNCAVPICVLQIWLEGTTLEMLVKKLVEGTRLDEATTKVCGGWLFSLPDRVAQAFGKKCSAPVAQFTSWLENVYLQRLVAAIVSSTCSCYGGKTDLTEKAFINTLDLWARIILRGNSAILSAQLCAEALVNPSSRSFLGQVISRLCEEDVSASRILLGAILETAGGVLNSRGRLLAFCNAKDLLVDL